jgi:uncharacterized membrane protein
MEPEVKVPESAEPEPVREQPREVLPKFGSPMGQGLTIGVTLGVVFGTLWNNLAVGLVVGLVIGVFAGMGLRWRRPAAPKKDDAAEE